MHRFLIAALTALALPLTACQQPTPPPGRTAPTKIVVVSGAHANAPAPTIPDDVATTLENTLRAGGRIDVINADSRPDVVEWKPIAIRAGASEHAIKPRMRQNLKRLTAALQASPDNDGANTSEAIGQAAAVATGEGTAIYVFSSLLDDAGALNMTVPGMLGGDPADLAAGLATRLPDLSGTTIVLVGAGHSAAPQQPLSAVQQDSVVELWKATLAKAGASVTVVPTLGGGDPVQTDHTVKPVPVPTEKAPRPCQTSDLVFDQSSRVRFHANQGRYLHDAEAKQALTPLGTWLAANPARTAVIRGTTVRTQHPVAQLKELGRLRAQRVADTLVELGARPSQLTVKGVGPEFPEYRRDRAADGSLTAAATFNRSVRITTTDHC